MAGVSRLWASPRFDAAGTAAWLLGIGLCTHYGRALSARLAGISGDWVGWVLALSGMAGILLAGAALSRLPAGRRARAALYSGAALSGLAVLALIQGNPIESTHVALFGILGVWYYRLLGHWRRGFSRLAWALLFTILTGALDETAQYFHPLRVGDPRDVVINGLAGTLAVLAAAPFGRRHSNNQIGLW